MPRSIVALILALVCVGAGNTVLAHHEATNLGTVRITQPVRAGGTVLQPGTYEVRDTGEHVMPLPGQSPEAQTHVEFVRNGMVVARDIAEVMSNASGTVGTSGGASRLQFQRLKDGNFARISASRGGERYLIHLPVVP
jgi:hypothetical protein